MGDELDDILIQCEKVSNLSLMCLIYRSMSATGGNQPFYRECINTARQALAEHDKSISLIESHDIHVFDMYINWSVSRYSWLSSVN